MNWDISFFKHVPMGGNRRLQFRVELYNAFNTDQWQQTSIDTSAVFNYVTGAQTDAPFGSLTGGTLSARMKSTNSARANGRGAPNTVVSR